MTVERRTGLAEQVERAEPARLARARKDWAAAAEQAVEASVAVAPARVAGRGTAELLEEKQPWKGKRHRSEQLAGGHACDKSSQPGFLSTLRPTFSDVLIEEPVSRQPRTSSYSSRNRCRFGMGGISATGPVRHSPRQASSGLERRRSRGVVPGCLVGMVISVLAV